MQKSSSIVYFDREGNEALGDVLKILKRTFRKREDLRSHKIVFFTAVGRGPAIAYSQLEEYDPKIIAVTFPPTFTVRHGDEQVCPQIPEKIARYFRGVGIRVITGRLPFDEIEGATTHNQEMTLITNVLSLFGGSFRHCVQAVLQACDAGAVEPGEDVISVTGDCAAVVTAAYTKNFLAKDGGLVIREILCKPRTLNLARVRSALAAKPEQKELLLATATATVVEQQWSGTMALPEKGTEEKKE